MDKETARASKAQPEKILAWFGLAAFVLMAGQFLLAPLFNRGYERQTSIFLIMLGVAVLDMLVMPSILYPLFVKGAVGQRSSVFFLMIGSSALTASIMAVAYWAISADLLLSLALHSLALVYLALLRKNAGMLAERIERGGGGE
ncbi:MAG: hypothetical protein ACYC55_05115 [Candidatus Geothermincolia bacterium]